MQATTDLLKAWFNELNGRFFGSELPVPHFAVGNSRTALGTMTCRRRRIGLLKWQVERTISISNYYDRSEDDFKNVLLHEMIHYCISVKNLKDTSPHGVIFRRIMARVNAEGCHVSVREKQPLAVAERNMQSRKPAVVLSMCDHKGARLLTVVNSSYALRLENRLRRQREVASWQWHLSTDETFNTWTRVRTLRARRLSEADFCRLLSLTQPLELSSLK